MKKTIIVLAASALFAGCATGPTSYGPATSGGLGFGSQKIENDRYQVSFTGKNADEARTLVLLRAAELTLANGYDHFKVIGSDTRSDSRGGSPISSSVGVGIGSGGHRGTRTNVGLGIGISDLAQAFGSDRVTANMEIITRNGSASNDPSIYNAQSIVDSIRPTVYTP
jgi:hypothetical protein